MRRTVVFLLFIIFSLSVGQASSQSQGEIEHSLSLSDDSLVHMGDRMLAKGNQKKAMFYYSVVCQRAGQPSEAQILAYLKAGKIFYQRASYAEALTYFLKGIRISDKYPSHPHMAELYKMIGNIYGVFEEYEKGYHNYMRGLQYAKGKGQELTRYQIYLNLVSGCIYMNRVGEARRLYGLCQKTPHQRTGINRFMDQLTLALILKGEHKYQQSTKILKDLAPWAKANIADRQYECSAYEETYRCYWQQGLTDSAFVYMQKCMTVAKENRIIHLFPDVLERMGEYYQSKGDHQRAVEMRMEYLNLRDSIYNQKKFDTAQNQQFVYEVNRYNQAIDSLQQSKRHHEETIARQRMVILCVLFVVLIVSLLLYLVYRQNGKLKSSYRHLYDLNQSLLESHKSLAVQQQQQQSAASPSKYKSSSLNEQQSRMLANQITQIMNNSESFCSPDFSLDKLAELVGSNSKYISQVIHEVFGTNFATYVNQFRIDKARERLADTANFGQYTIKAIGESVGFKSQTSFTNTFKKATGITPAMYQKIALSEAQSAPNS